MAAYTLALNNVRVIYLGANLPASELASAIEHHAARLALLSAARGTHSNVLLEHYETLRAALGDEVSILVGGSGFADIPAAAVGFQSLRALNAWAQSLLARG